MKKPNNDYNNTNKILDKLKTKHSDSFLKNLPLNNKEKLRRVFRRVGVPERSNGIGLGYSREHGVMSTICYD